MLPDRVSNPRPLTYESGALPIALRGPATRFMALNIFQDLLQQTFRYFITPRMAQRRGFYYGADVSF